MLRGHDRGYLGGARRELGKGCLENDKTIPVRFFIMFAVVQRHTDSGDMRRARDLWINHQRDLFYTAIQYAAIYGPITSAGASIQ
jgi:hypothetical protein